MPTFVSGPHHMQFKPKQSQQPAVPAAAAPTLPAPSLYVGIPPAAIYSLGLRKTTPGGASLEDVEANFPGTSKLGGRLLQVMQYVKSSGKGPGKVIVSGYWKGPDGKLYQASEGQAGYFTTVQPGQMAQFNFSVAPHVAGKWICHVDITGDLEHSDDYWITVA